MASGQERVRHSFCVKENTARMIRSLRRRTDTTRENCYKRPREGDSNLKKRAGQSLKNFKAEDPLN